MVAMPEPNTRPAVCDNIIPELHPAGDPATTAFTEQGDLDISGIAAFPIPAAYANHSRYLVIRHRNARETWSASLVTVSSNGSYSFASSPGQAYGSHLAELGGGIYGIYSGDVNRTT